MESLKRILVPTDFSREATYAFELAQMLSDRTGAAIKLLHVVERSDVDLRRAMGFTAVEHSTTQLYNAELLRKAARQMDNWRREHARLHLPVVEEIVADYMPDRILSTIRDENVDLVVMGTKGASGIDEVLVGSNTERVVRQADCPVLSVKSRVRNVFFNDIIFASTFKDNVRPVASQVKFFHELFGGTLHLLHVAVAGDHENSRKMNARMHMFAEHFGLKNYTVNIYSEDNEEDGILKFAREIDADLIMAATHGRTGLMRLLSGSIAGHLVNHSARPVLTFRMRK